MLLPEKFNQGYIIEWVYEGKGLRDFTDDDLRFIIPLDQRFRERQRLANELREKIINPLIVLKNKHSILKEVLIRSEEISHSLLYKLIEDSARQNITDFYDLMDKFIDLLGQYKNNYSPLFNKDSQKKLLKACSTPENIDKYCELSNLIDQKRNYLFSSFNQNGEIQKDSWCKLIDDVRANRDKIKSYRDKVASHADDELVNLSWREAGQAIESFLNYTSAISTVLSFGNRFETGLSDIEQMIKILRSILFEKNRA